MDASKSQRSPGIVRQLPVITLLMVSAALIIVQFPEWSPWLVYDRSAILSGQIWRLFTGHWVHFSTSHLIYDSLALGVAGWIVEIQKLPNFGWMCLIAPWLISGVLLVVEPRMELFGGLSALATAAVVYLALCGLGEAGPWRWICLATLQGFVCKMIYEIITGRMMFVTEGDNTVTVSTASHISGALIGLMFYGRTAFVQRRRREIFVAPQRS
jgi:rhomboid family GlyGly-CTERM serine protease